MRLVACSALAVLALAGSAGAASSPDVQGRIVPGASIGKVKIGMSLKQVKAVLGQPEAVIRREQRGFTRSWVEYSWNFTSWRVGFQVYKGRAEVVSIRASVRGETTREGVGYGTPASRVQRAHRTQCKPALSHANSRGFRTNIGYACVVRGGFFIVNQVCGNVPTAGTCASKDRRWVVLEYGVLGAAEKAPFELTDFDDYWKPLP